LETKHEGDFHDGRRRSNRIFCGFFCRDLWSGKDGTDHTSGTLLPVIRSRNGLQLYKLRAMRGNGFRYRWRLHRSRCGTSSRRSSSAQLTNLHPGFIAPAFLRHRDQGFRRQDRPTGAAQRTAHLSERAVPQFGRRMCCHSPRFEKCAETSGPSAPPLKRCWPGDGAKLIVSWSGQLDSNQRPAVPKT
jgi:hypothetical protein